eukprot:NODE_10818_length_275_cov_96.982301_g9048_i0.p2 GENE.NODE_10818_length_275_cov_96.982301_g9048_i0~~NODE_10818_length_275_cov_96.982301_g9048_i0.p2  ORF type:complete len:88 (-),score=12.22 NODE_10818_length_275_cov_96.982301_g9048_i0:11-274(-)
MCISDSINTSVSCESLELRGQCLVACVSECHRTMQTANHSTHSTRGRRPVAGLGHEGRVWKCDNSPVWLLAPGLPGRGRQRPPCTLR